MKKKKLLTRVAGILILIVLATGIYLGNYYKATYWAREAINNPSEGIRVEKADGYVAFAPENPVAGFIFYPGAKVEYTAYAPLMEKCAENKILSICVKMPFNMAFFDIHAADDVMADFPEIDQWYIGGHSLGGSMAAMEAADTDSFKGLVLLASFSTKDFTDSDTACLSLYGNHDQVLNMDKYKSHRSNLKDPTEIVFEGGNHGNFGYYGDQAGDGQALISRERQQQETADTIAAFVKINTYGE